MPYCSTRRRRQAPVPRRSTDPVCGIAGWFSAEPSGPDAGQRVTGMVAAIAHRGPDGQGYLVQDHAVLGHARLAIIDVAGGAQPLWDADNKAAIVFNGEIYNYRKLRASMQAKGHRFVTLSDTEVILALYLAEGITGLSKLRGMYAFAIWDAQHRRGLLARDPLGIKPLFVHQQTDRLLFGSEAKALLAAGIGARLDEAALHLLLNFRYLPGQRSLFRGIHQLSPGQVLRWTVDGRVSTGWISATDAEDDESPNPSLRPSARVLAALDESVAAHLVADVQVGAYLSGGIDSAAIVALARGVGAVPTYTLAVGDDPAEAANAARTAALLGVDNAVATDPGPLAEVLPALIAQLELPKVNAWQVSALACHAARRVKVVLSGLGGDELFYGYNMHSILARTESVGRLPGAVRRAAGGLLAALLQTGPIPWSEPRRMAMMVAEAGNWPRVYGLLRNIWDSPDLRRRLYGPRLLDQQLPNAFDELAARWPAASDPVTAAARFEWREKMVNDLLWQEDRVSMAHGLEVRVPFVDRVLARAVAPLSRAILMPGGQLKGLLRESLQPLLPAEILDRPKSGFQVDAGQFWQQQLAPLADTWLSDVEVRRHGLFNPAFVRRMRRAPPRTGLRWHFFLLYLMLGTHVWLGQFEQGVPSRLIGAAP